MWLFLAGEGGFTGSSSLKDPVESKANVFNPLIPKSDQREKLTQKSQILLLEIHGKWLYNTKVLPKSFHLNGNNIRFCAQTRKLTTAL